MNSNNHDYRAEKQAELEQHIAKLEAEVLGLKKQLGRRHVSVKERIVQVDDVKAYVLDQAKASHDRKIIEIARIMAEHIGRGSKIKIDELAKRLNTSSDSVIFRLYLLSCWVPVHYAFGAAYIISDEAERKDAIDKQEYAIFTANQQIFNLEIGYIPQIKVNNLSSK